MVVIVASQREPIREIEPFPRSFMNYLPSQANMSLFISRENSELGDEARRVESGLGSQFQKRASILQEEGD